MQISSIRSSISSAISNFGSKLPTLTAKQKQISLIAVGVLAAFTAIWAIRRYLNKQVSKPAALPTPVPAPGDEKAPAKTAAAGNDNKAPVVGTPGSGSSSSAANNAA